MKIFIIGSEGFIGRNCVDYFLMNNMEVSGVDFHDIPHCKYNYEKVLPNITDFSNLLKKYNPYICLFASGSANVGHSLLNPFLDMEANAITVFRILESIRVSKNICKFINISSAAVYGSPDILPIKESSQIQPVSSYGWHKYYSELICKEFNTVYNIPTCSVRPFSVYGPGQKKLLFWDIYQKSKASSDSIELYGTGKESRDFIYIEDLVRAIHTIIDHAEMNGESYNLASGVEHSIDFVSKLFLESINYKGLVKFNQVVKQGDPLNWKADIGCLKKMGFSPKIGIEKGIDLYIKWLSAHNL